MVGVYQRKWSFSAKWCERIALVCIPYFLISIILHRTGQITSPQAFWLIGFGLILIFISLALGFRAFLDLWNAGQKGGKATIRGIILVILLLAPFVWFGYLALTKPLLSDVSTNPFSPPQFVEAERMRYALRTEGINQFAEYDPEYSELLLVNFPEIGSRRYNAGANRVYQAVNQLISTRKWPVSVTRGLVDETGQNGTEEIADDSNNAEDESQLEKATPFDVQVEAIASSPIYGFKRDVLIHIIAEEETTLVDMRASSRWGPHDFGTNAQLIKSFLADLDKALVGISGEG
ncbi:MAG: DUF1499 domain-containing protein [Pseudomonadota bacterium]